MKRRKTILVTLLVMIIIFLVGGLSWLILNKLDSQISENIAKETFRNRKYYIIKKEYEGEYDLQYLNISDYVEKFEVRTVMNYEEYSNYCKTWNLKQKYTDNNLNYIVYSYNTDYSPNIEAKLIGLEINNKVANLYIWDKKETINNKNSYIIIIPTEKNVNAIEIKLTYTEEEINTYKKMFDDYNYVCNGNISHWITTGILIYAIWIIFILYMIVSAISKANKAKSSNESKDIYIKTIKDVIIFSLIIILVKIIGNIITVKIDSDSCVKCMFNMTNQGCNPHVFDYEMDSVIFLPNTR